MSDVTALVLSIGEEYAARASASIERQTVPVAEIVCVRGVSPFHRALNAGVARVRTEFFVQVDADMILDDTCIAHLRACVHNGVGIVVGHLRDPLLGRVEGVKLFRTECFQRVRFPNSLSPDTDFGADILNQGWTTIYALKSTGDALVRLPTFGEHRPEYSPLYTFSKYMIEGARRRYRKSGNQLHGLLRRLQASPHESAAFGVVAAAHGFFAKQEEDLLQPYERTDEFEFLETFFNTPAARPAPPVAPPALLRGGLRQVFTRAYALGIELRQQRAGLTFLVYMQQLRVEESAAAWVALVGLCHGVFADAYREVDVEADFAMLEPLLTR